MNVDFDKLRAVYRDYARVAARDWKFGYDLQPDEQEILDANLHEGPVLDAGCGVGRSFAYFEQRMIKVVGLDAVPEMLERAAEQAPLAELVHGELSQVGALFSEDRFGAVICLGNTVGGLVADGERRDFFAGVARVLKPGGLFVVDCVYGDIEVAMNSGGEVVIDNRSRGGGFGYIFEEELAGRKVPCYQYYFSEAEFARHLADAGFRFDLAEIDWGVFKLTAAVCRPE